MDVPLALVARPDPRIALGLGGLALAVAVRVRVAGADGARSIVAGLVFGLVVAAVAVLTRGRAARTSSLSRSIGVGVFGAAVLCVPAAVRHQDGLLPVLPLHGYLPWAAGVVVVAVAEEALLRGSLFGALQHRAGTAAAIGVSALAFGLLHVPLYGWGVLPLDIAVGVWLGALRATTGSVVAPATAHCLADLAGWWLR
jgi:membrane protease YdiL (CAAX protease family)